MANVRKKLLAQELRKKGYTISEIAKKLRISRSTISQWCRDISLTPEQIRKLVERQRLRGYEGRLKFSEKIRKRRIKEAMELRKEGLKEIGKLSKRDFFIAGVAIYWCEGYTSSSSEKVNFTNSDPKMLLFMLEWFKKICNVENKRFSVQITINQIHRPRIAQIEEYWSKLLGIPKPQFTKTVLIKTKPKKIYRNFENYYGTVKINVKQPTKLRRKIEGWIEGLSRMPGSRLVSKAAS